MCLYCVKYWMAPGPLALAESPQSLGHVMFAWWLTFAHASTVSSLRVFTMNNEMSTTVRIQENILMWNVMHVQLFKTRTVLDSINYTLLIVILCDNVEHYGPSDWYIESTMGWHSAEWTQHTYSDHCRALEDSCRERERERERLLRCVRAWECLEFGGQAASALEEDRRLL